MCAARQNQQIIFKSRPDGYPTEDNFESIVSEVPEQMGASDVLVQLLYLSVDPYLRTRMNAGPSYAAGFELGKVLIHTLSIPLPSAALSFSQGTCTSA